MSGDDDAHCSLCFPDDLGYASVFESLSEADKQRIEQMDVGDIVQLPGHRAYIDPVYGIVRIGILGRNIWLTPPHVRER